MKTTKNIARLAVTAGLTAALSLGGVMAPVTMAFAEGTPVATTSGNVTIKEQVYTDTTFKGIQIFSAKVTQNRDGNTWSGDKTLSDIAWASNDVRDAVTGEFSADTDSSKPTDSNDAAAWAEWIKTKTTAEYTAGTDQDTKLNTGTTLDRISKALESKTWTDAKSGTTGSFEGIAAGYWLFETKSVGNTTGADGNDDAYTSPIFTVVGGEDVKAKPKKDVPNVTKAVMDDKDGSTFGTDVFTNPNKAADSASDQPIKYQLAGTVASNINTYEKYSYTFTDELPLTMEPKLSGNNPVVEVKIGESVVNPACYTATYVPGESANTLTVSFENLKEAKDTNGGPITIDVNSKVYVNYEAKLVASRITADMLGKAQVNNVKLTYSNNPHAEGVGTTVEHPAYDYTYGIDVTKVGSDNEAKGLEGVEFTLQEKDDTNNFIKADGTKTTNSEQAKLKTDASGKINVVGLDEGTYILKEVTPAPGYNNSAKDGVTFTIRRTLNQAGQDVAPSDSTIVDGLEVIKDATTTTEVGKLSFTIVDKKGSNLPLTGLNGVTFTWIAGGAVLCIGVAHLIRSRKRDEGSEE